MDEEYPVTLVKDLLPDSGGINILGIVICKHTPKTFKDSRQNSTRCVSTLTLRDKSGYVNCNVWGGEEFVKELCRGYAIGDVVIITNAQVSFKSTSDENFNPSNQSQFTVAIGDKQGGKIAACEGEFSDLKYLLHAPVRPHNDYYNLSEILEHGESMEGQFVNILGVVKNMTPVHQVRSKNGRDLEKIEITFFDDKSDSFTVVVWEPEYFNYIQQWSEKRTVVFAVDIRLNYNKFKKCMQGSFTSKTLCVQDPDTNEAHQLYDYALEYADQLKNFFGEGDDAELCEIDEVKCHTIEGIRLRINNYGQEDCNGNPLFRSLAYVAITNFNIDDNVRKPWNVRCESCKFRLSSAVDQECRNESCVTRNEPEKFLVEQFYDMQVSLSDHTGTLDQCRVSHTALEAMLGMSVEAFQNLNSEDITEIKWSWLMERCKVRLKLSLDKDPVRPWIELCEKPSFEEAMTLIDSSTTART